MNATPGTTAAEIAHVLFLDICGYSRQSTTTQGRWITDLTRMVSATSTFELAKAQNQVLPIPTGDGMALLFSSDVAAPARCAVELFKVLQGSDLEVRMGIHSGLVQRQTDIAGNENVAGEGINMAQRVMDLADGGHILMSAQYATWLMQFDDWKPFITHVGEGTIKHGSVIEVYNLQGSDFGRSYSPAKLTVSPPPTSDVTGETEQKKIVILYKRKAQPDEELLDLIESRLSAEGHNVFIDRHLKVGVEWAKAIELRIREADAVVVIVSDAALGSEMLEYEIETAHNESLSRGKPEILPVRVGSDEKLEGILGTIINPLNYAIWHSHSDDERILSELTEALSDNKKVRHEPPKLEPAGGAVSPNSPFYVERDTDKEGLQAILANESIVLVKGPRQMGKTSFIGRAIHAVSEAGWRYTTTDFQKLSSAQLGKEETFYKLLAATLARQLKFQYDFENEWLEVFGSNLNMDNFLRSLIEASDTPLVWFMDEADKMFGMPYASDFFGLVRSWHNSRATEPYGPWGRLTVVIGYATEAHLFIQDINQSPFNVGRQLNLQCFTVAQVSDLNQRYGSPLKSRSEIEQIQALTGGQPFLTRRTLDILSKGTMDLATLLSTADRDDGPFGDHLKRILVSVSQMPTVMEAMRSSLESSDIRDTDGYHRLLAAGVVYQTPDNKVAFRSDLYRRYLLEHLASHRG